ncbi:CaiB/BaiF CoA transferase family protein [Agromyces aerolatus]|uniref:CaiB/BaiF CoA transferase family protein n=1 Tax=Agromyces sp. LY-1074 TaxID=3074080 RepID=UPI00285F9077|nr:MULTISPECIES: CaiB/BaiF CoA-transferase family protein [unclassified Agromyces]MDR5699109.1 CaiB/BaiF CoA-transferase family protein [Agromyces sp. LY-1074]MDR5705112.1 CaiB/BaiF CoA-transferase family protein [Agromyces sp. LY-1358]
MTQQKHGPLSGVRVVEFAGLAPSPYSAMILSDLGADVVRIDRPPTGDELTMDPRVNLLNRGKRSIALDLRQESARAVVFELIRQSDILIEGFRPGVMERLGFGPDEALAVNPRLVYGRMTGWGQDGPYAMAAGHDIAYVALTGTLHAIGDEDPVIPLNLVGDFGGGGAFLTIGVLAALHEARTTGAGQVVDAAMVDGAASLATIIYSLLNAGRWEDRRRSNLLDGGTPFYAVYRTADDRHVAVGAIEPKFFAEFVAGLGVAITPSAQYDRAGWPAMRERIAERIAQRTQAEWVATFDGTDACVSPVLSLRDAPTDPHVRERGTLIETDGAIQPGVAPRFPAHDLVPPPPGSSPLPGAQTRDVLAELGFEDVDELIAAGVAVQADGGGSAPSIAGASE